MKRKKIKPLEARIAERIARSRREVYVRDDFKDLGGYDQVGRGLRRLVSRGQLIKIGYGLYARSKISSISGKAIPRKPLPLLAVEALKRLNVESFPSRYTQAYNAGRTNQVPTGRVVGVKGRICRRIGYDDKFVTFERTS